MLARNLQPEVMDQPGLDAAAHRHALSGLARINAFSRSASLLWPPLKRLAATLPPNEPLRVLDIASGGGDVCLGLARKAERAGLALEIQGLDISPLAVEFARSRIPSHLTNIRFETCDVFSAPLTGSYHATMSSLFLHHLTENQAVELLTRMAAVTEQTLLINDLCRSRTGIAMAHLACRLLTRSPIVHADGPQSVAAAFTRTEMHRIFNQAELRSVQIQLHWPFRQLAQWNRT